jgi:prepilin-type N-terminal cleavage/methylation domain-containing protein
MHAPIGPRGRPRRVPPVRRRAAFTMVELTVSLAILSIVVLACGSVIVLAARALNNSTAGSGARATAARAAMDQISADLKAATGFSERTASAVTFTVPDRTGDGQPETIRYAWSGAAGASIVVGATTYTVAPYTLTRQFNGGAPVSVADNVQNFGFNYLLRTVGPQPPPPAVESSSQSLSSHDGGTGSNIRSFAVNSSNWPAEYVLPTFTSDTVSWKITGVRLMLMRSSSSATGTINVQVRTADSAKKPTSTVLGTVSYDVAANNLSSTTKTWVDLAYATPITGLTPGQGVCVVVTSSTSPANVYYDNTASDAANAYSSTSNSGGAWSTPVSSSEFQFVVSGTYTTQGPAPTAEPAGTYQ